MINQIKKIILKVIAKKRAWSIGIFSISKTSLFEIESFIPNEPTITALDITDCKASFVADPFLIKENGIIYCFFEIKDKIKNKGVIGVSSSQDGINFDYQKIVLEEQFHLSYPSIYAINGEHYMIPESGENNDVRLYKANDFTYDWKLEKILLQGKAYADATITFYENRWYMFVSENTHDKLEVFYSDTIDGTYQPHSQNPIYTNNLQYARCGGTIIKYQNNIYRFGQDCHKRYGEKLYLLKIETLTPSNFKEKRLKLMTNVQMRLIWNARKMHHASYLELENFYLVAMDGEGFQ